MTMIKRGTCSSKVVVSQSVYSCPDCGYVEMTEGTLDEDKKCPHCDIIMTLMSSSSQQEDVEDTEEKDESKDEE